MQQQRRRLSAAGASSWILMDTRRKWFGAAVSVSLSSGAVLTYTVQHTFDPLHEYTVDFAATRSGTTLTVRKVAHGLSVGDWFMIEGWGAPGDAQHIVASVVDADNFTSTVANSGNTASGYAGPRIVTARVFPYDDAELAGASASADGNYMVPPSGSRLLVSAYTSGFAELTILQQGA